MNSSGNTRFGQLTITTLLFFALSISGCASNDSPEPAKPTGAQAPLETQESGAPSQPANASTAPANATNPEPEPTPAAAPNNAPNVTFFADVTEGAAPLAVTFSFDAEDLDGDDLSWSLDIDSDGTADFSGNKSTLPGQQDATYVEGTYTATLTVSDGNASVERTIEIVALTPPPPCKTLFDANGTNVAGTGRIIIGLKAAGIYIVTGTDVENGVYQDDNGIPGLQTIESCPTNADSLTP